PGGAAGGDGRPGPPGAAHPPRLRGQEPPHPPGRDRRRARRRGRRGGEAMTGAAGHLLSVADLGADGIEEVLRVSDSFVDVSQRAMPKVPALRGKTVVSLFFEESTRTRLSFEAAAKGLSADPMDFWWPSLTV